MQLPDNKIVFVKSTLIHDEKAFKSFRNFFRILNFEEIQYFDEFNYDAEKNEIIHKHIHSVNASSAIAEKVQNGYVLISLAVLKKMY